MRGKVRSSEAWRAVFEANAGERKFGPEEGRVTAEERRAIAASIQEFQLGETGEGMHIMRAAKVYATRSGDAGYPAALRVFIAEEIRHARELKGFMTAAGIPVVKHTWVDGIFRMARRLAGLELSIAVLVCAEIVAKVYYAALGRATGSTVLRRICEQILRDEVVHVEFQSERVAILRRGVGPLGLWWRAWAYRAFFRLTLLVVWWRHGRAIRAGGLGVGGFWKACVAELWAAMRIMDPRAYDWDVVPEGATVAENGSMGGFWRGRVRSVGCAVQGLWFFVRSQKNAWVHLAASAGVIGAGIILRLGMAEWCWIFVAMGAVWVAEAMNTAVELVADAVLPREKGEHVLIGRAKDVAAGGVLLAAGMAVAIGGVVMGPHLFGRG